MKNFLKVVFTILTLALFMAPVFSFFGCCSPQQSTREYSKDSTTTLEIKPEVHVVPLPEIHETFTPQVETDTLVQATGVTKTGVTVDIRYKPRTANRKPEISLDLVQPVFSFPDLDTNQKTAVREKEFIVEACSKSHTGFWDTLKKISIGVPIGMIIISLVKIFFKTSFIQRIKHLW